MFDKLIDTNTIGWHVEAPLHLDHIRNGDCFCCPQIQSHVSMMHAHLFGAYFGLMVSWTLYHSSLSRKAEKERSRPVSDMFAVLGTLFLWIFWPSFNSALIMEEDKKWTAIYNTYFVMATSTIAAFSFSIATSKNGKLSMAHIQNATLAGGVALGFSASNIQQPWIAMVLGLAAGTVSVLGMACLQKRLDPALKIHDTSGVLYTFGLPSLLGGIIHVILILTNHSQNLSVLGYSALIEVGALSLSLCLSLFSGLLTGLTLTCKLWKTPPVTKYFDDQVYWEVGLYLSLDGQLYIKILFLFASWQQGYVELNVLGEGSAALNTQRAPKFQTRSLCSILEPTGNPVPSP
ncbi:PREDICTED: RH-like protein isoform X1 [Thamnophis sirtalis]|uniref:RH-like protein isoform X1 n=1 Tax=Thamnophis sirtalis TaxID=35019 RepID=A0A6I9WVZ1_9SAUR|nr:PREDICTED: RH-like protein isoform X1 [Thamnophis sirtalis]